MDQIYRQDFNGNIISHTKDIKAYTYLRYLCMFVYSRVQHILCCVSLCLSSSGVTTVSNISGLYIFDCPFGVL